ncbi:MAG TPA: hypothetical protein VFU58_06470 [Candidatus Nitrosotalea sp.]|nr:hypothetical protein [Candidatus Nitrosotalea sp.]
MISHTVLLLVPVLLFFITVPSSQAEYSQNNQVTINVNYANDTSYAYTIHASSHQKYTVYQKHSWTIGGISRYNLQAYSIDNGPVIPINRSSSGNFTLDLASDTNHSILFIAKPQFEVSLQGTSNATFSPTSPTNDNWFDADSDVQFIVPYIISSDNNYTRQQIVGWSLDSSDINIISNQASDTFKSPVIHMSEPHTIDLKYKTQYYVNVITNFGRTLGTGWYNSGTIVDITALPGNDVLINHVFLGWQGPVIGNINQESTEISVDSPKILVANWSADYTNISMTVIIIIAVIVILTIYLKRKNILKL